MSSEATSHTQPKIRVRREKPFEKVIWIGNSTAVLFAAFWTICVLQDVLVWVVGNVFGVPLKIAFDEVLLMDGEWRASQVLVVYGFIPMFYLFIGIIAGILHKKYRMKRDLRKLFFLWMQFLAFSIFGGSFITSFIERGNVGILWEYLHLEKDFMPLVSFFIAALLIFFGVLNLWKFLNIAPSSEINKSFNKRFVFVLCIQIFPLLIFFALGFILYPHPRLMVASRLFSALMIWVPILAGLIASVARDTNFSKVPAFKDSEVHVFQPLYLGLAALVYVAVLFLS